MNPYSASPFVSVIMPIRNESVYITQSLTAILEQDYPPGCIQIIIVDGESDDNSIELIHNLSKTDHLQIISNPLRIQAAGMNLAIRIAQGDIIVRVDGHTVIAPDYIRRCVETLAITGASNAGGSLHNKAETLTGRGIALASRSKFAIPTAFRISSKAQYTDTVYMGAWPRCVFENVGLFDEHFMVNEDYEFNFRIRASGGSIYFSPEICSEYYGPESFHALAKKYFRYGASKPQTLLKHPKSLRLRHLAAPTFTLFVIGGIPLSIFMPFIGSIWSLGIIIYMLFNIVFSFHVGRREKLSLVCRIPLVFIFIHTTWGCGFWFAIIQILVHSTKKNE